MTGLNRLFFSVVLALFLGSFLVAQVPTSGGLKGKVRREDGSGVADVAVAVLQGDREVGHATTDKKGNFIVEGLAPGSYGMTFRKPGLSVGSLDNVEVRAGKVRTLSDRLILRVDEGSLAFLRGSVFDPDGHSIPGARVELVRMTEHGTKRLEGRVTDESGSFVFRLMPDTARYRVTVTAAGGQNATREIEISGAAIYRVALSLHPTEK
jgi:hypothetical protein